MTSSYNNTNYLSTEADMSSVVNKQIDADIKDTQDFYDQMAQLEKARYDQQFDNLKALSSFVRSVSPIIRDIQNANEDRKTYKNFGDDFLFAKSAVDSEYEQIEKETKEVDNETKKFGAKAEADANNPDLSNEERKIALEASRTLKLGSFVYEDDTSSKANVQQFGGMYGSVLNSAIKDDSFASLDNKILTDFIDSDSAKEHLRKIRIMAMMQFIRQRRAAGHRELSKGEIRKYLSKEIKKAEDSIMTKWSDLQDKRVARITLLNDQQEISSMFQNPETVATDALNWITNKKEFYEAGDKETPIASRFAFEDFGDLLEPMLSDPDSGVDAGDIEQFLDSEFTFSNGTMKLSDPRAPKGAKGLYNRLVSAAAKYKSDAIEQEEDATQLRMAGWEKTEHVEFKKQLEQIQDPKERFIAVQNYVLQVRKEFNIGTDETLPEFVKKQLVELQLSDEKHVVEITARRVKKYPITQSMVDQIADPDIRAQQSEYVNTPELGALTEDEVKNLDDEKIPTIVRDAKDLTDLTTAKTDKFLVARDNAKEYIVSRFKQLVVGGQPRSVALSAAIKEAKGYLADGTFDTETTIPIDPQATLDLQATLTAIQKDTSLIYSTEDWAGETPHLDIAAEYVRTKGRTRYPSYYLRFTDIKRTDGSYLTPEEVFETRLRKTGRLKDGKIIELPERKELKNDDGTANVEDQNKLLNKPNPTKTLDVAYKKDNIEWMIKTMPSVSGLNAEKFIRQLETNIQNQQFIGGVSIPHKKKTTLSKEDNDKLLEAVPELKEAPFLNPNTLSTAAINAMLKLNI